MNNGGGRASSTDPLESMMGGGGRGEILWVD